MKKLLYAACVLLFSMSSFAEDIVKRYDLEALENNQAAMEDLLKEADKIQAKYGHLALVLGASYEIEPLRRELSLKKYPPFCILLGKDDVLNEAADTNESVKRIYIDGDFAEFINSKCCRLLKERLDYVIDEYNFISRLPSNLEEYLLKLGSSKCVIAGQFSDQFGTGETKEIVKKIEENFTIYYSDHFIGDAISSGWTCMGYEVEAIEQIPLNWTPPFLDSFNSENQEVRNKFKIFIPDLDLPKKIDFYKGYRDAELEKYNGYSCCNHDLYSFYCTVFGREKDRDRTKNWIKKYVGKSDWQGENNQPIIDELDISYFTLKNKAEELGLEIVDGNIKTKNHAFYFIKK